MDHIEFDRPSLSEKRFASAVSCAGRLNGRRLVATRLNVTLICLALGGTMFQLFGLPLALRAYGLQAAWLLLPIMLLQPIHWGLIHEAIHSHLLPNRRADEICARMLSVSLGVPFGPTRFSHLVHHRFSRHAYDRPDIYDGRQPLWLAIVRYWGRLFGGVYLGILVSPLIACVPMPMGVRIMEKAIPLSEDGDSEVRRLFVALVLNVTKRRRTRRDFAMSLALYAASAWVYGAWWPMLLATMYVRGVWHSLADNIPHHGVGLDEPERARDYALPSAFRLFLMNQHLHLTHHLHPTAPWTALAALRSPEHERPNDSYFRAALRQFSRFYPLFPAIGRSA